MCWFVAWSRDTVVCFLVAWLRDLVVCCMLLDFRDIYMLLFCPLLRDISMLFICLVWLGGPLEELYVVPLQKWCDALFEKWHGAPL